MLEGILVIGYVVVVVVRVSKETVARCKDVRRTDVRRREESFMRLLNNKHIFCAVSKVLSELIAQICICVTVSYDLHGLRTTDRTVIRGQHDGIVAVCLSFEEICDNRVTEPGERDGAVSTLIVGKLTHHLRFSARVRKHVDEVDDNHIQIVVFQ